MEKIKATVTEIKKHCHDTISLFIKPQTKITFKPGQFVMAAVPFKDTFLRRAYSVANIDSDLLELCLNHVEGGIASTYLCNLNVGDTIEIDGPWGVFTLKEGPVDQLFIGTGTGISALRPMIHTLLKTNHKQQITLIFGERSEEELFFRKEFEALEKEHNNFIYVPVLSRKNPSWQGQTGYVQHVMKNYINNGNKLNVYICGLKAMITDVQNDLLSLGVDKKSIYTERYD